MVCAPVAGVSFKLKRGRAICDPFWGVGSIWPDIHDVMLGLLLFVCIPRRMVHVLQLSM
jgi:hypothetical protein